MTTYNSLDLTKYPKIWATLITNSSYLTGVLMLNYSIKKTGSKYPLVALYTESLDSESIQTLHENNIMTLLIDSINPSVSSAKIDKRFIDTWSKLYFFKLTQFKRIVQLDSDMIVLQNIDELMNLDLQKNAFASTHSCLCNPFQISNYPQNWIPENCVYLHSKQYEDHQILGIDSDQCLSKCNSGILVVDPSLDLFQEISAKLNDCATIQKYIFPDQDLLSDVFYHQWLSISAKYNTLKTFKNLHPNLWELEKIKIVHYILSPKPWMVDEESYIDDSNTFELWWKLNTERISSND